MYLKGSPDADGARAAFLKRRTASGLVTVPATNLCPIHNKGQTKYGYCRSTSTSILTGEDVNVTYGSWERNLDQVTPAPNLAITNQSIGDALSYHDVNGVVALIENQVLGIYFALQQAKVTKHARRRLLSEYLHVIPGEKLEVDTGLVEIPRDCIPSVRPHR
ncbi:hypothetical protein EV363DRAFT_1248000 [Boletus edulis]|nr:hypothetical protein EV363DRAFT_1248000 [Boletus edulis]